MAFGNYEKYKLIEKSEEEIKKIHSGIKVICSNKQCKNKLTFNHDELNRKIMCTKCNSGFFIEEKKKKRKKNNRFKKNRND
ncbi:hypothetical protein AAGG74_17070 [Bacillus mexicanus]|uniref:hypothetical protein n=1 Tax=Bacillus mexicanus TaxID=2834415 RepID=UPI003D252392